MGATIKEDRWGVFTATLDPAAVATITTAEQTFTVPGLKVGDVVIPMKPALTTGVGVAGARVSAADTLAITFVNPTAGSVNPASEVWTIFWFRAERIAPGFEAN